MNNLTDEQIADGLVEEKILDCDASGAYTDYWLVGKDTAECWNAKRTINDWRVAGACLERMRDKGLHIIIEKDGIIVPLGITPNGETVSTGALIDDSLPRAICEAYVRSLSDD